MKVKRLDEFMKKETASTAKQQPTPQYEIVEFYRETEFQETEIGKIPKEWKIVQLSDLFEFQRGLSYRKYDISSSQTLIRFITINDLEKEGGRKHNGEPSYLLEELRSSIEKKHIAEIGDILIAITDMSKGFIIGAPLYVDEDLRAQGEILVYSMDLVKLQPKKQVDTRFYYYVLMWDKIRRIMKALARGTNVLHLDLNLAKRIKLPEPPLNEQKSIAEILAAIDNAIESVDRDIAKLERLKRALMRELLTGRVRVREENGKLVFYRETAFQETEIGKIPREWKVVRFKEVAEIRKGKRIPERVKSVAFIPMEAIPDNSLYVKYKLRNVNEVKSYVYCEPGDILLAKITPSFENGKQGIVPEELQGKIVLATTEVYPISCKNIDKYFLFYLLKYPPIRNKLTSLMRGTTGRKRVPREALEELLLPYPPITEQQKIAEILSTIDKAIELYYEKKMRFKRLKRGLMDLLLTGKVRVRVKPAS